MKPFKKFQNLNEITSTNNAVMPNRLKEVTMFTKFRKRRSRSKHSNWPWLTKNSQLTTLMAYCSEERSSTTRRRTELLTQPSVRT
jgi:hypothetical protein